MGSEGIVGQLIPDSSAVPSVSSQFPSVLTTSVCAGAITHATPHTPPIDREK